MPQHSLRSSMCSTSNPINHDPNETSSLANLCSTCLHNNHSKRKTSQGKCTVDIYATTYPIDEQGTYWLIDIYEAKSLDTAYSWPVAWRKYLFPSSPNFQYSGSWYLTPLSMEKSRKSREVRNIKIKFYILHMWVKWVLENMLGLLLSQDRTRFHAAYIHPGFWPMPSQCCSKCCYSNITEDLCVSKQRKEKEGGRGWGIQFQL